MGYGRRPFHPADNGRGGVASWTFANNRDGPAGRSVNWSRRLRNQGKRLMKKKSKVIVVAFISVLVAATIFSGMRLYWKHTEAIRQREAEVKAEIKVAVSLCSEWADNLHELNDGERYSQRDGKAASEEYLNLDEDHFEYAARAHFLPVEDPWDCEITIVYFNKANFGFQHTLRVCSRGPDGHWRTEDDIVIERELPKSKGELRGMAEHGLKKGLEKITGGSNDDDETQSSDGAGSP